MRATVSPLPSRDYSRCNIALIGMPGTGKSTVGMRLASRLGMNYVDTDTLIEARAGKPLQHVVEESGYLVLRQLEAECLLELDCENTVISTGGSAVYSHSGMKHLRSISVIVYLRHSLTTLYRRINNFGERGLAKPENQSFEDLYLERLPLYVNYADQQLDCEGLDVEQVCDELDDVQITYGMRQSLCS